MQRWKGRGGALDCRHSPKQPQTDPRPPTAVVGTARGLQSKVGPRKVQHGQPPSGAGIQGQGQLKTEETANTPLTVEVQACGGGRGRGGTGCSCSDQSPAASQPVACGPPGHHLEPLRPLKPGPPAQPIIPVYRSDWAWPPSTAVGGCTSLPMLANCQRPQIPP